MRDEIDSRMWVAHHEAFSRESRRRLAKLRLALGRFIAWDGSTAHLLALVASLGDHRPHLQQHRSLTEDDDDQRPLPIRFAPSAPPLARR